MNYHITIYLTIFNTLLMHIPLQSMEITNTNNSMTQIFEIITNIDQHCIQTQNSLKNLRNVCEKQYNSTQHKTITDHVNTHIDIFHTDIQKGNKFLNTKGTFTHDLLITIKKNIISEHTYEQYLSIIDESVTTITNIRDMTLLKIIAFAQKQPCETKQEISELIIKSKKLTTTHNTIHYLVLYTCYLNQYLPCIKKEKTRNDTLIVLTMSKNHIDTLIHKKMDDIYTNYKENNQHLFFIKKLSTITLEQALLRTYLAHISQDNTKLFQLLKQYIKDIDDIRDKVQENIAILNHSKNVLQQDSLNFKDLLTNIIIIEQYLPSQPIHNQKTEFYIHLINLLSDYAEKLNIITIEKEFFDITIFTQLVTSLNNIREALTLDSNNQHIINIITIHEKKINQMLDICINIYKNIINSYDIDGLIDIIKALFDSYNKDTNEILQPYQTTVIDILIQYKQITLEQQNIIQSSPQMIISHVDNPVIPCNQIPIQNQTIKSDQEIIESNQKPIIKSDKIPQKTPEIIESPIIHREQTQEIQQSIFWPIVDLCLRPFQFIYAVLTWLFS